MHRRKLRVSDEHILHLAYMRFLNTATQACRREAKGATALIKRPYSPRLRIAIVQPPPVNQVFIYSSAAASLAATAAMHVSSMISYTILSVKGTHPTKPCHHTASYHGAMSMQPAAESTLRRLFSNQNTSPIRTISFTVIRLATRPTIFGNNILNLLRMTSL